MDVAALERELGASVRAARLALDLRQVDLAEQANVSLGALKHLEAGAGSSVTTLVRVAGALGREDWLRGLGPASAFNPLALLDDGGHRRGAPRRRASPRPAGAT